MVSFTLRPPYPRLDPAFDVGGLERSYISSLPRLELQFVPGPARNLITKPTELARFYLRRSRNQVLLEYFGCAVELNVCM